MSPIPEWPEGPGARVLTLVGNDVSIDARARKTATSLARSGFSVLSLGIDKLGEQEKTEILNGAVIFRVSPPSDPRISPRLFRWSLAEVTERLGYRVELQRQRLQMSRRDFTSTGSSRAFLTGIRRSRVVWLQRKHQVTGILYRFFNRLMAKIPRRSGRWRRDLPELHKYEAAVGPLIDHLKPDLVHVHDIFHLGVAIRAKRRAQRAGREVAVVYDAHEYIAGLPTSPLRRTAYMSLEEEYIRHADAAVTVSPGLAALLWGRYGVRAEIVMNAPELGPDRNVVPLRTVVGLGDDARLLVYVGGVAPHRGGDLMLDAMTVLEEDVHLVLVTNTVGGYVADLRERANDLGLGERVHLAPFVPSEHVVEYLRSADVGVIPLSRDVVNYEIALPNKLFQSIHAGLPVAVSDNPEMAEFVSSRGFGQVFDARDPVDLARAVTSILRDHDKYVSIIEEANTSDLTWAAQAETLIGVYSELGVNP